MLKNRKSYYCNQVLISAGRKEVINFINILMAVIKTILNQVDLSSEDFIQLLNK